MTTRDPELTRPSRGRRHVRIAAAVAGLATLGCVAFFMRGSETAQGHQPPPTHVGTAVCARCHEAEYTKWKGSHHDLAMQEANEQTVLGDFENTTFTHYGVESRFYRREGGFFVHTEGPDGKLHDYRVKYTFGVAPLQQYLIEFPGGRLQTLGICWDTRPKEQGGQRWFHIYQDERIRHDDPLHWTGRNQNWNYMCAACHSTNLRKNYELEGDRFQTTWSEINVACEACHGPGSRHVELAELAAREGLPASEAQKGLLFSLDDRGTWEMDPETNTAKRQAPLAAHIQVETCAPCHSHSTKVHEAPASGRPLLNTHRPSLLVEPLYYADGQILDEVYVYGSFLQSKMYHAGVTCSDCHDPHSLKFLAPGNLLCASCHLITKYDAPSHHFHERGTDGAACIQCHMPARTYMVVDPRNDHSIRIPRPDLSVELGTPNACNSCHKDRSAEWAADAVTKWYGSDRKLQPHYGEALAAGRSGRPDAVSKLVGLVRDAERPAIVRATALDLLAGGLGPVPPAAVKEALQDDAPLLRLAALGLLETMRPQTSLELGAPLLEDPLRSIRTEAARTLAMIPGKNMSPAQSRAFEKALDEFTAFQLLNADQPWAHVNLGLMHTHLDRIHAAEASYKTALRLDPQSIQGCVNLADLYRLTGQDVRGEGVLREGLGRTPDSAEIYHALGLFLVRQKRSTEALRHLELAARLRPENPRFGYVHAVALESIGQLDRALAVLEVLHARHRYDRDILFGLVTYNRRRGNLDQAIRFAKKLLALSPGDRSVRRLLQELRIARSRR